MKKFIVLGLCAAMTACGGEDSVDNDISVLPEKSSIYDGVYTADNGDSLFYSIKENVAFIYSPLVEDNLGTLASSNRLISFKSSEMSNNKLKTNEFSKIDVGNGNLLYSNANVDIDFTDNGVNIISITGEDPDFGEKKFYQNKPFEKVLNDQVINIHDGNYKTQYGTPVTVHNNILSTIYDDESNLSCDVTMNLIKSKYYYQATHAVISCKDDPSHSINGDYIGVVYAANEQAIMALTKPDLSQSFRASFALNN